MDKILANIKHWQSTALGFLVVAGGILQSDSVQQLASISPKIAHYVGTAIGVVAGATAILGMGAQPQPTPAPPQTTVAPFGR